MTSLKELVDYIDERIKKGHTLNSIKKSLQKQGIKIARIEEAIEERARITGLNKWLNQHPFMKYWDPVIIYTLLILILSFTPAPPAPEKLLGLGNIITSPVKHFILYLGFSFILGFACRHSRYWFLRYNHYTFAIIISVALAIIDEHNQLYVPGRTSDLNDVIADSVGATAAQVFRFIWRQIESATGKSRI